MEILELQPCNEKKCKYVTCEPISPTVNLSFPYLETIRTQTIYCLFKKVKIKSASSKVNHLLLSQPVSSCMPHST